MRLRLEFDQDVLESPFYNDYCKYVFRRMRKDLRQSIPRRKYAAREKFLLESGVFSEHPPRYLNLSHLVGDCLELKKVKGVYEVRLSTRKIVPGTTVKLETLVRLLEYGCRGLPPLPFIRQLFFYYRQVYKNLVVEFLEEVW